MTHVQVKFKPFLMMDFATLTGACMIALGKNAAGIFGNDDALLDAYSGFGKSNLENLWRMPIFQEHHDNMKGTHSDL